MFPKLSKPLFKQDFSWRRRKFFLLLPATFLLVIFLVPQSSQLSSGIQFLISLLEDSYRQWFEQNNGSNPFLLLPLAFLGGLLASFSPCILALLPVNLSYIGTLNIRSRRDAFLKALLFVLGAVTILSLFGLASAFATAILVDFKGFVHLIVGIIIILMGLSFAGLILLPFPKTSLSLPFTNPYSVGLTFALVSSPCASPVLFAVLAAAAAANSQLLSVLTMVSYALGYTALIFLASLFTGIIKQSRVLLVRSGWITKSGGIVLFLTGVYYSISGLSWFF